MVLRFKGVAEGAVLAVATVKRLVADRSIWLPMARTMGEALAVVYALYLVAHVFIYIPLYIVQSGSRVIAATLGYDAPTAETARRFGVPMTPRAILQWLAETVPFLALDLVVHLNPGMMEVVFFAALRAVDPIYTQVLLARPKKRHIVSELVFSLRRSMRRFGMALGVVVLGRLPVIGQLALPAANLYVFSKVVGYPAAAGMATVSLAMPAVRQWAMFAFQSVMAMSTFSRDVFKPYFRRVAMKPKDQVKWYKQHESELVGFLLPFYLLTETPWAGAIFYVLAQAAAALYIAQRMKLENILLKQHSE
ncbi:hypothetical protein EV182_002609 [Spiromyces aspiralis]|uniref:Uncharacterized protein n=1 Tax=Spiromyces aspiralis TaxID=68401 RepID=A0ACC1HS84_9FUNG|nr:hypothetical protein EV182_002609 [Spiromyces aspiralis]